ncbi:hypothetical protein MMC25_006799 [Agyrium rufum]|nr:hypothetical protein [Agyrium rufum]
MSCLFLVVGGIFPLARLAQAAQCFYPDGTAADNHTPCTGGEHSACCYKIDDSHHDLCWSNGICMSQFFGYVYRGSCTDSAFKDPACSNRCLNGIGAKSNASTSITACGDAGSNVCCGVGDDATACCESGEVFQWGNASILADSYGIGSSSISVSVITAANPSSTISSPFTAATATITSINSAANQTNVASGSTVSDQEICGDRTSLEIGLGVGLGLPLLLVSSTLALLLVAQRRRKPPVIQSRPAKEIIYIPSRLGADLALNKELPVPEHRQRAELSAWFGQEMDLGGTINRF